MSFKSRSSAVVLAVVCLPVVLLSLEADAQPTADENTSGSATLEEIAGMVKEIAANQRENAKEIGDVKRLVESSNEKYCECATANPTEHITVEPSRQALISALVCEYSSFVFSNESLPTVSCCTV